MFKTDKGNRVSWYIARTGTTANSRDLNYVCCRNNQKTIYLHAYIMNHMFNSKGKLSVDHIDQNPLNNRLSNLRIVNQSIQNQNTSKRSRRKLLENYLQVLIKKCFLNMWYIIGKNKITN